eukprot:g2334.t1
MAALAGDDKKPITQEEILSRINNLDIQATVPAAGAEDKNKKAEAAEGAAEKKPTVLDSQAAFKAKVSVFDVEGSQYLTATTFAELEAQHASFTKDILKGLTENCGFQKVAGIQEKAIPRIITPGKDGKYTNLIAQAKSGSGKTIAFTVGMLARVDRSKHYPQVMLVCPTRDLAIQNLKEAQNVTKFCENPPISLKLIVQGETWAKKGKMTEQVLIGTVGSLRMCMTDRRKKGFDAKKLKLVVLDEGDAMVTDQNKDFIRTVKRETNPDLLQILFFSATFSDDLRAEAEKLCDNKFNKILVEAREDLNLDHVSQFYVICDNEQDKREQLKVIMSSVTMTQVIIFVNRKALGRELHAFLAENNIPATILYGGRDADVRLRDQAMEEFRSGVTKCLITSNVLSRGIDVPNVSHVINFDMPADYHYTTDKESKFSVYLQRVGRAGRFDRPGVAINLITAEQEQEPKIQEEYWGMRKRSGHKGIVRIEKGDDEHYQENFEVAN